MIRHRLTANHYLSQNNSRHEKIIYIISFVLSALSVTECDNRNEVEDAWQQEYTLCLDSCKKYQRQIKNANQISKDKGADDFDFRVNAKEQWKNYAIEGINLARKRNSNYWKCIFLEQLYDYYICNAWSYDAKFRNSQSEKYARQLIVAITDLHNTDSLLTAISHYLYVTMRMAKSDTAAQFIYKQAPLFKRKLEERSYKKVLCFTARQLAYYNDTANAKKMLREAMGQKLSTNTNEAIELRIVYTLWNKHSYKEAANAYLSLLEADEVVNEKENLMHESKEESAAAQFHNVILICILVVLFLIGIGFGFHFYSKWKTSIDIHTSEIERMKTDVDSLKIELEETKMSEANNKDKILALERRIELLQQNIRERLRLGRIVYEALAQGEHIPADIKCAETYLLDYVMIKQPELYARWKEKYSRITPHMYTYLLLQEMGKTNDEIEETLSITPSSLRSLRSRQGAKEREKGVE